MRNNVLYIYLSVSSLYGEGGLVVNVNWMVSKKIKQFFLFFLLLSPEKLFVSDAVL